MKAKAIRTTFELATVAPKRNILSKSLDAAEVTIEKKELFVGVKANWKIKWKEVINLEIEGATVFIETKERTVELVNADQSTWYDFKEALEKRWSKLQEKIAEAEEAAKPILAVKPRRKAPKAYGSKARERAHMNILASAARNNQCDNWSEDEMDTKDEPAPVEPEVEDSEEEQEAQFSDVDEVAESEGEATAVMSDEEDFFSPAVRTTRPKAHKHARVIIDDSDEEDADMTSPAPSLRLVTPRAATVATDKKTNLEDEEEPSHETEAPKNQPRIASFFNARAPAKSSAVVETTKAPTTPPRKIRTTSPMIATTPLANDNERWIEATDSRTPIKTPQRRTPLTPAKLSTPRSLAPKIGASRHFGSKRSVEETDEIEEFDQSASGTHKRLRRRFGTGKKHSFAGMGAGSSIKADGALALAASTTPKNPYARKPTSSTASTPPLEESAPLVTKWKGLHNLGNTCYLNSSLQLLYTVRDFCTRLVGHGGALAKSVTTVDRLLQNTLKSSVSPRLMKDAIDKATDRFSGYEQRDAHEFLSDLIDRVHDELEEEVGADKENATKKSSVLTDEFFRMNVNVCLKCDNCSYERTMEEMYRHLSIEVDRHEQKEDEVRPKWTVTEGIEKFFQSDQREVKCEKCEEGTTATQTLSVKSRPKALILQLKRFVVKEKTRIQRSSVPTASTETEGSDEKEAEEAKSPPPVEMVMLKNKDPVVVDRTVDLDQYVPKELKGSSKYKLSGIVHHHGGSPSSGHYTTDAIRFDNKDPKWATFDDGSAHEANIAKILRSLHSQRTAYLLLYTLED